LAKRGASLKARIEELERKVAESVPKNEFEALQAKVKELEGKVEESVPKGEFESAKAKIRELETKLAAAPTAAPTPTPATG
jgi:BMFP domain-containing protein YqiC